MLNKNLENALNKQINAEFWSAYLYLSMSTHFASEGLNGAANWFKIQFKEEQDHALKIIDYVISREGRVELAPIDKVSTKLESLLAAFLDTLEHEKVVTARIHEIVGMAREEKDFATENMLQWFVNEQVEEEETAQKIIDALKLIGNNGIGIYLIDKELGKRT
jgi:ferritin